MKKFLMYVIIVVTCLFLGFTIYYLSNNDENIKLSINKDESIYLNKGELFALPIDWSRPNKKTTLAISIADDSVARYDEDTKQFECKGGGFTTVTITPSNEKFGPFVFELYVGDGTKENPYVIKTAQELGSIGNSDVFTLESSYMLIDDIDLKLYNNGVWTPLGEFNTYFNGNGHTIYNLNVTQGINAGLFDTIGKTGLVENIKFTSVIISGTFDNAGAVAGVNKGTIGKIDVKSSQITNTLANSNTGLIAGSNMFEAVNGVINACSARGRINANGNVGGIVGYNYASLVLNSKAIVDNFTSTALANFGGIVGKNSSYHIADNLSTADNEEKYYPSAIKNSYSVIEKTEASNANIGGIVGLNDDPDYSEKLGHNIYEGTLFANTCVTDGCGNMANPFEAEILAKTKADLLKKETYSNVGYNFDTVWMDVENTFATLNFDGSYETYRIKSYGAVNTGGKADFIDFLTSVKANKSVSSEFVIDQTDEWDLEGQSWPTIATDSNDPMIASISVAEGVTFTIKNFRLTANNSSFFGYVSGNNTISGLTFKDVIIDGAQSEDGSAGVVVTGLLNGAELKDITVSGSLSVDTQAKTFGIICANNYGTVDNCVVDLASRDTIKFYGNTQQLKHIGGLVGYNYSYIKNSGINNVKIDLSTDGNFHVGCLVGTTEGSIDNSYVDWVEMNTSILGQIYGGGLVGYTANKKLTINKCYSFGTVCINRTENEESYVGGITAYLSTEASIKNSFFGGAGVEGQTLICRNVGGLVGLSYGDVSSSYVGEANIKGAYVGGFAHTSYGDFQNCYTLANLTGTNSKGVVAGFSYLMLDGLIQYCFGNASFHGEGKRYCETKSEFRLSDFTKTIGQVAGNNLSGDLKYCIVLVKPDCAIQRTEVGFSTWFQGKYPGWIDATEEECNGTTGNYEPFTEKAGFPVNAWNFDKEINSANGGFPTLKNVVTAR